MNQILTHAPYAAGSDTSLAAASSLSSEHLDRLEERVFAVILDQDSKGVTCDQIEELTGLSHQTASARIHSLFHRKHRIHDSGLRRATRSGRAATVYLANLV